jgi:hypothetical protein
VIAFRSAMQDHGWVDVDPRYGEIEAMQRTRDLRNLGSMVRVYFMPEAYGSPCLWLVLGDGSPGGAGCWQGAPISDGLLARIDEWLEVWLNDDRADGAMRRETFVGWRDQGLLLWALANRELIPQGYVVEANFEFYGRLWRLRRQRRSVRRLRYGRAQRFRASAHQTQQIITAANSVLRERGEPLIQPLVPPAAIAKNRSRRYRR